MMEKDLLPSMVDEAKPEEIEDLAASLRHFQNSYAWKYLSAALKEQYENRMYALLTKPLKSMDETLEQEYTKGECASLLLLSGLLPNIIEYLETLTDQKVEDERADTNE